ncbi:uncharacterized protein JCM6883_000499 [Sporobolomyces salmoneus]|uniref:uncharacterized protein n=1 Tax=Sporobolomyces salmoneus TaxID=183962 RepID=UPI00317E5104
MDDFSWGSTREIVGEHGKRLVIHDEGKFDPKSIPLKTWTEFENELWEAGSNESIGEIIEAGKQHQYNRSEIASAYGAPYGSPSISGGDAYDSKAAFGGGGSIAGESALNLYAQPTLPYGAPGAAGSIYGGGGAGSFHQSQQLYPAGPTTLAKAGRRESTTSYFAANAIADYHQQQHHSYSPSNASFNGGGGPSNEQLQQDVMEILSTADLQTLTKKKVRQELEARYGAGFKIEGERKTFVNRVIGEALGLQ